MSKGIKIYKYIRSAIYLALGVLVLIFISPIVEELRYFIGGLMLFYGAEGLIFSAVTEKRHFAHSTLYWNAVEIILGVTMICFIGKNADIEYAVVCVTWATWSILREVEEIEEVAHSFFLRNSAILNLIESAVAIGMSIFMLIEPTEHHAKLHLYLLFVELATKALFPILDGLRLPFIKWVKHEPVAEAESTETVEVEVEVGTVEVGTVEETPEEVEEAAITEDEK